VEKGGGEILLGEEVTAVKVEGEEVTVRTRSTSSGEETEHTAPYCLITLPLGVLQSLSPTFFSPPLPARRLASLHRLGHGLLNKVHVLYASPWWAKTHPNDSFLLLPSPLDPEGTLGDPSHPQALFGLNLWAVQGTPGLCIFLGGTAGETLEKLSDEEVGQWVRGLVKRYLWKGAGEAPEPERVLRTGWRGDRWARGSYCYIPPFRPANANGEHAEVSEGPVPAAAEATTPSPLDITELSRPLFGRLFFAGEHTEPNEFASVHGAWGSGLREAGKLEVLLENAGGEAVEE